MPKAYDQPTKLARNHALFNTISILKVQHDMQWAINRKQPLCNAVLPGTHNSGITLADGYGNLDLQYQEYFKWISWVVSDTLPILLIWARLRRHALLC